jgi:hypothetical protein
VFTEPLLPTAVILVPSFWLSRLKGKIKTHRQQDDFISFLLFFQNKEDGGRQQQREIETKCVS